MRYSQSGILKDTRPWGKMFVAGAAAVTLSVAMFASAFAAGVVTVTPSNLQGWTTGAVGGSSLFVADASAPNGSALQLVTDANNESYVEYYHDVDAPLSTVGDFSYKTRTIAGPSYASASYAIGLNTDSDEATDVYYVYEPYWQVNFGGQAVVQGEWQDWNVKEGTFWKTGGGTTKPSLTWDDVLNDNIAATVSEVAIYMGTYNPGYTVNVDTLVVNDVTYDFQTTAAPSVVTTKEQCKNNGWKDVVRADESSFKNQGQCVAYVQSSANSKHNRP